MPDLKTKPSNIGFCMQAIQVEWEKNHKYIKLREIGIFQKYNHTSYNHNTHGKKITITSSNNSEVVQNYHEYKDGAHKKKEIA